MKKLALRVLLVVFLFVPASVSGAERDHTVIYPRLICVVPIIGSGTMQDPFRPLFSPNPQQNTERGGPTDESSQIIAFQSVPTDDGKAAIVMLVARSYAAFAPVLNDSKIIRSFERNRWKEEDLTRELQKYKKNFDLKMLRVGAL